MLHKKHGITLSLLAFVLIFFSQATHARPFEQTRFADDPKKDDIPATRYVRSRNFDSKHIALNLSFDWESEKTIGTEEFTFAPLEDNFTVLKLDAGFMEINSVKLKGGNDLKFNFDEKAETLSIMLDRAYNRGEDVTVEIKYQTKGGTIPTGVGFGGGGGLTFIKPTVDDPNRPWQIWSQGESEYNKYWFPSFDYPNDFRTSEMTVTVKKPLTVISNGELVSVKDNGSTQTFHWVMRTPYANYLTSIVVGEYAEVKGNYKDIPISTYVYKNWKTEGEATAKRLPDMVRFFSEKLGIKYPYSKYAQTIAYNFGGGMENITATTQTDKMISDARTMLDSDYDGLQAHELAHQWFGDYVTCRDWSEIWLNESFATYMEALYTRESKGNDTFLLENQTNQNQYFSAWNQGNRRPIVTKNYANPDSVFDAYAYPRGGAVLHMLRKQLGEKNFWLSLNHYLTQNANQPVSTEDLRIAIEETTGQSMDAFFDQWVYRMGHPIFQVEDKYDASTNTLTLTVKQVQKIDESSDYPQVKFFQTPVEIEIRTENSTRVETVFIKPQAENIYTFKVDSAPLLIDFDNEGTLIKKLEFKKSIGELEYQMNNDTDVIGRKNAMSELAEIARKPDTSAEDKTKIISAIGKRMVKDPTWEIRTAAIQRSRSVIQRTSKPGTPLPKDLIAELVKATGDKSSSVRKSAISMLGTTNNPIYAPIYKKALEDPSYDVIDAAAMALGSSGAEGSFESLAPLLTQESWNNRIQAAGILGLTELKDGRVLDRAFLIVTAKNPDKNLIDVSLVAISRLGKKDPRAFPLISKNILAAAKEKDYGSLFARLGGLIELADPRGQEVFDSLKVQFKDNGQILGYISQFEQGFKAATQN